MPLCVTCNRHLINSVQGRIRTGKPSASHMQWECLSSDTIRADNSGCRFRGVCSVLSVPIPPSLTLPSVCYLILGAVWFLSCSKRSCFNIKEQLTCSVNTDTVILDLDTSNNHQATFACVDFWTNISRFISLSYLLLVFLSFLSHVVFVIATNSPGTTY
jgi:hypothetical protein